MNEFKGTKGKWERVGSIVYMDENSKTIYPHYECGGFGMERDANALLISKAPEMLEMLICCQHEFDNYLKAFGQGSLLKNKIEQLIKEATEL